MSAPSSITGLASQPRSAWRTIARLPSAVLLGLIAVYQRTISPVLPVVTMGACACRFSPTCSHYATEAIRVHGAARGSWLALTRLVKCTPLHPGGFDPVPVRDDAAPRERKSRMSARRFRSTPFSCDSISREPSSAPRGAVVRWSGGA